MIKVSEAWLGKVRFASQRPAGKKNEELRRWKREFNTIFECTSTPRVNSVPGAVILMTQKQKNRGLTVTGSFQEPMASNCTHSAASEAVGICQKALKVPWATHSSRQGQLPRDTTHDTLGGRKCLDQTKNGRAMYRPLGCN